MDGLELIRDELNKYDCEAFINAEGMIRFKNSPSLCISFLGESYSISYISDDNMITASYTQPLKVVYYILKGLWKLK